MENREKVKAAYIAPTIEMYEVLVEQGFSSSIEGIGEEKDEIGW